MHTHTHIPTAINAYAYSIIEAHTCMHIPTHTCVYPYLYVHTFMHANLKSHMHTNWCPYIHRNICTCMHTYTCTHTFIHSYSYMCTFTCLHPHSHMQTFIHVHTHSCSHTDMHPQVQPSTPPTMPSSYTHIHTGTFSILSCVCIWYAWITACDPHWCTPLFCEPWHALQECHYGQFIACQVSCPILNANSTCELVKLKMFLSPSLPKIYSPGSLFMPPGLGSLGWRKLSERRGPCGALMVQTHLAASENTKNQWVSSTPPRHNFHHFLPINPMF